MRVWILTLVAALLPSLLFAPAFSADVRHPKTKHVSRKSRADSDCVPINGRYGYYGNPWCDTGSSRPPDIEFRERHRLPKR